MLSEEGRDGNTVVVQREATWVCSKKAEYTLWGTRYNVAGTAGTFSIGKGCVCNMFFVCTLKKPLMRCR